MNKKLLLIPLATLTVGFILGRFTAPAIKTQEKHLEAHQSTQQTEVVQTHSKIAKESTTGSETRVIRKYYCPTEKLKSVEKIERRKDATTTQQAASAQTNQFVNTSNSAKSISTVTTYGSRWGIGLFLPAAYRFDPKQLTLMLSYHITYQLSVAAQSDVLFKRPMVGMIYQL